MVHFRVFGCIDDRAAFAALCDQSGVSQLRQVKAERRRCYFKPLRQNAGRKASRPSRDQQAKRGQAMLLRQCAKGANCGFTVQPEYTFDSIFIEISKGRCSCQGSATGTGPYHAIWTMGRTMTPQTHPVRIAALYQFTRLDDLPALRSELLALCQSHAIKGTLLLAREGINGTIAGTDAAIAAMIAQLRGLPGCAELEVKYSRAEAMPFRRMKVRLKAEIVTMGQPDIDPLQGTGHYLDPQEWNALIADPDVLVIDTRNAYEVEIGTFQRAVDPGTRSFREFPGWFRQHRDELLEGKRKVAMFCTGGIRCEKSTAFLKAEGIDQVYHLKGGILKYLEDMPPAQSLWQGECFVFDERVSVGHGLMPGPYASCKDCGRPHSPGQNCAHCA